MALTLHPQIIRSFDTTAVNIKDFGRVRLGGACITIPTPRLPVRQLALMQVESEFAVLNYSQYTPLP
jgi:hypothetical protein